MISKDFHKTNKNKMEHWHNNILVIDFKPPTKHLHMFYMTYHQFCNSTQKPDFLLTGYCFVQNMKTYTSVFYNKIQKFP